MAGRSLARRPDGQLSPAQKLRALDRAYQEARSAVLAEQNGQYATIFEPASPLARRPRSAARSSRARANPDSGTGGGPALPSAAQLRRAASAGIGAAVATLLPGRLPDEVKAAAGGAAGAAVDRFFGVAAGLLSDSGKGAGA